MGDKFEVQSTGWHFTMVPNSVLFDAELSTTQKCVFVALCSFMDSNGSGAYPSYRKVAERASCSKRAAIAAINNLVNRGYVIKDYRINDYGEQTSNTYKVVTDAPGGESDARGVVNEVHPGSESGAPKRDPSNESHFNERGKRRKVRHEDTGLLMSLTSYNNYTKKYSTHTFNRYAEKIKAWHDSKGKKYPADLAAAVLRWTLKDEDEGKGPTPVKSDTHYVAACKQCGIHNAPDAHECSDCGSRELIMKRSEVAV